jgi:hypothetical protein
MPNCAICDQPITFDPDAEVWRNQFGYAMWESSSTPLHYHDPGGMMAAPIVRVHIGCGGVVLWDLSGGYCIRCHAENLEVEDTHADPHESPHATPCDHGCNDEPTAAAVFTDHWAACDWCREGLPCPEGDPLMEAMHGETREAWNRLGKADPDA